MLRFDELPEVLRFDELPEVLRFDELPEVLRFDELPEVLPLPLPLAPGAPGVYGWPDVPGELVPGVAGLDGELGVLGVVGVDGEPEEPGVVGEPGEPGTDGDPVGEPGIGGVTGALGDVGDGELGVAPGEEPGALGAPAPPLACAIAAELANNNAKDSFIFMIPNYQATAVHGSLGECRTRRYHRASVSAWSLQRSSRPGVPTPRAARSAHTAA